MHFRKLANELTLLLTYEATKDFPTEHDEVETPLERTTVQRIAGKKVAVCPVLRAGLGMLDGVLSLVSSARVGFIGLYRDEETLQPVEYYIKLPELGDGERDAIVLDPMLATGRLERGGGRRREEGGREVGLLVCLVAAPEGIAHFRARTSRREGRHRRHRPRPRRARLHRPRPRRRRRPALRDQVAS